MTHGSPSTLDLTDTQLVLLSQASQRADGKVVPPAHLKGGIFKREVNLGQQPMLREVIALPAMRPTNLNLCCISRAPRR